MAFRFLRPPPCSPFRKDQPNTYSSQNTMSRSRFPQHDPQSPYIHLPVFSTPPPPINICHQPSHPFQEQNSQVVLSNSKDQANRIPDQFYCPPPCLPVGFSQGFDYPPSGDMESPARYPLRLKPGQLANTSSQSRLESISFGCPSGVGRYPIDCRTVQSYQSPLVIQNEMKIKCSVEHNSFDYPRDLSQVNTLNKLACASSPVTQRDFSVQGFDCTSTREVMFASGCNIDLRPSILQSETQTNAILRGFDCPSVIDVKSPGGYPVNHKPSRLTYMELPVMQSESQIKQMEEAWINSWLTSRKHNSLYRKQTSNMLKVYEVRLCLQRCKCLLQELNITKKQLSTEWDTLSPAVWRALLNETILKKEQLSMCLSEVSNTDCLEHVKKTLTKRKKKRQYRKRRNVERREKVHESHARRQQLHRSIDAWLKDMQGLVERAKREESLKKEADVILLDVTRRKAEARRQLALLSSLKQLRELRIKMAVGRGEIVSADYNLRFNEVYVNLQELWEKQLKEYNIEEQGLRLMLNEAVDERDHTRTMREKRVLATWEQLLFGVQDRIVPDFYLAAESTEDAFVHIRQSWDKFLAPEEAAMSSAIPIGWIVPTNPSTVHWEGHLSDQHRTK